MATSKQTGASFTKPGQELPREQKQPSIFMGADDVAVANPGVCNTVLNAVRR